MCTIISSFLIKKIEFLVLESNWARMLIVSKIRNKFNFFLN